MEVTNIDLRPLTLGQYTSAVAELTFGGAGTKPKGTILARSTATGKMIPYAIGGVTDGNGVPSAVLLHDVTATGAGDVPCDVLTTGQVALERLIVEADGDASNITGAVSDLLRDFAIVTKTVTDQSVLDNQ